MKLFTTTIVAFAIILAFTGCSQKLEDGILKVDTKYKELNSKTKVYFVDNSYETVRNQLKRLVDDLNNTQIIPPVLTTKINLNNRNVYGEPTLGGLFLSSRDEKNNTDNVPLNFQYKLDEDSNYIFVTNKKYVTKVDAYLDYENIMRGVWSQWLWNSYDKRDEYGTIGYFGSYDIDEIELYKNQNLKFTTYKEKVRKYFSPLIKKQILDGGYEFVNNPNEADKIIEVEFGRDYTTDEIRELKKLGKSLDVKFSTSKRNFYLEESAMNIAGTLSHSSSVGAGVGLGVALVGILMPQNSHFVPIFIKVIDKKENKEFLIKDLSAKDPMKYSKVFMSDEIYETTFNSEIAYKMLRDIQYGIYTGLIKDNKYRQEPLNP